MTTAAFVPYILAPSGFNMECFTGGANPSGPIIEIQSSATDYLILTELSVAQAVFTAANTAVYGLGFSSSAGVGFGAQTVIFEDSGNNSAKSVASLFCSWTKFPGIPTNFLRRRTAITQGATAANNSYPIIWRFPNGLKLNPSSSLVLWLITVTGANASTYHDVTVVVDS